MVCEVYVDGTQDLESLGCPTTHVAFSFPLSPHMFVLPSHVVFPSHVPMVSPRTDAQLVQSHILEPAHLVPDDFVWHTYLRLHPDVLKV